MPRPVPTPLYHFTSIHHLASIIERGLLCDNGAAAGPLAVDVGNRGIKERRRRRVVPVGPSGVVADYVPFYFAPRSPMLYAIAMGNVPEYTGDIDSLVYLATTADRLAELGLPMLFTRPQRCTDNGTLHPESRRPRHIDRLAAHARDDVE